MRRLVCIALAVAASATAIPVASAAPSLSPAGEARFPERSFVLTLPAGTKARPGQVAVTENGRPVSGLRVAPVGAAKRSRLGVVLAVDTSRSMRGAPVAGAFAAARTFARERNENQPLAVVTFDEAANVAMPLTTDPFVIQQRLARPPETHPETHLYDAGLKAVDVIRESSLPGGFVIVLSDGADYGSDTTLAALAAAARDAHVRIYTVGLESPVWDPTALQKLASSAGGTYSGAGSPADLDTIYSTLSAELSNAYIVRYRSVAGPHTSVDVRTNVEGVGAASTNYTSPRLAVDNPDASDGSGWSSDVAVAIAVALIAGLLALALIVLVRRRRQTPRERIEEFVAPRGEQPDEAEATLTDRLASSTERSLSESAWWGRFSESVDIAGMPWSPARLFTNSMLIGAAAGVLLAMATGFVIIPVVCIMLTPVVLSFVVRSRVRHQQRQFSDQLADHLAVVGSSLRAGHSFPAALASVLDEAPDPSRREFGRAVQDEHLGAPLNEALERVARRMNNRDIDQVALLALLQREAGADAAEMLDGVVQTIRERQELRRMVRTLTAQGRLSRAILTGLPVAILIGLQITNPDYIDPLLDTNLGRSLMVLAVLSVIAGSFAIKRIVTFEI